jgi:hypothetical protein
MSGSPFRTNPERDRRKTMTKVTTVGSSYMMDGKHLGPGPWLGLIHECNRRTDGKAFQSPEVVNAGIYTEVYPDFDVRFQGAGKQDMLVTIVSKNAGADALLKAAAESMDLTVEEDN